MNYARKRTGAYPLAVVGLVVGGLAFSCQEKGSPCCALEADADLSQYAQEVQSIYEGTFEGHITQDTDGDCPWKDKSFVLTLDVDEQPSDCWSSEDEPDVPCDHAAHGGFAFTGQVAIADGPVVDFTGSVLVTNYEKYARYVFSVRRTLDEDPLGSIEAAPDWIRSSDSESEKTLTAFISTRVVEDSDSEAAGATGSTREVCNFLIDTRKASLP